MDTTSVDSPVERDVILDDMRAAERSDKVERLRFLFATAFVVNIGVTLWEVIVDASALGDPASVATYRLIVRCIAAVLCALPFLWSECGTLCLQLLGFTCTYGIALAETRGQHVITGYSLLLSVVFYFGYVHTSRSDAL